MHVCFQGMDSSGWQEHIRRVLDAAVRIAHWNIIDGCHVLVHCSDGWDRTPQLTSLSMLMMDPYYRTIKGFQILIEQEWFAFGHKFADRGGWSPDGWFDDDRSPIFEQFLHCVFQIYKQHRKKFEFNESFLLFLAEHSSNGLYGNFLANTDKERKALSSKHFSIWMHMNHHIELFRNPMYKRCSRIVIPNIQSRNIQIWINRFLKWNNTVAAFSWDEKGEALIGQFNERSAVRYSTKPATSANSTAYCYSCGVKFTLFRSKYVCKSCKNAYCHSCMAHDKIGKIRDVCKSCAVLESS